MLRVLPWSLAGHVAVLALLALCGGQVSPPRHEARQAIRVRLGGPPKAGARAEAVVRAAARQAPPPPVAGTRRMPSADKPKRQKEPVRPVTKGRAPDARDAQTEPEQAPAAGATGTDQPFPFDWYLALVEGQVSRNWNPAQLGFGSQAERSCTVHFVIGRNGSIAGVSVSESSGVALFDREALRAVAAANPLPPLPRGFGSGSLGVTFIFTLRPGS